MHRTNLAGSTESTAVEEAVEKKMVECMTVFAVFDGDSEIPEE